ncbi:MAG TPA: hypothetical protein PKY31_00815 [Spirochaetota bacterium]|nr:hypothetical protein [Spirochaetota bacterium]
MPASNVQNLKILLGGAEGIEEARLQQALDKAGRIVVSDGIAESHESFGDLQEFYAAHLLETSGAIGGAIASRAIADISVSFAQGSGQSSSYLAQYRRFRASVIGIRRIV